MKQKRRNKPIIVALVLMVCVIFIKTPGVVYSDETVKPEATPYSYNAEGKPDPFNPFIDLNKKKEVKKVGETVKAGAAETKTEGSQFMPPLQRYDIEEFKLVAIGGNSRKRVAIVRNSAGKSYSLFRNTKIGMNEGTVTEISNNQVVIMEKTRDAMGKITPRRVVLKLTKYNIEGDK